MSLCKSSISIEKAWKVIIIWFIAVMFIFIIAGEKNIAAFGLTYGLLFGGLAYRFRYKVKPFFKRLGLYNYRGFLLLSLFITAIEEWYCYSLGNRIAYPVLWIDLIVVGALWTVWFGTWFFYLSKKYIFSEKEALMTAASTGVLYEFIGTGYVLQNPAGIFFAIPLGVVVYAAIFVLPMQLIEFTGNNNSRLKFPVGIILPFILTVPAAVFVFIFFALAGRPLE